MAISGEAGVGKSLLARLVHLRVADPQQEFRVIAAQDAGRVARIWDTPRSTAATWILDDLHAWPQERQRAIVERAAASPKLRLIALSRVDVTRLAAEDRLWPGLVPLLAAHEVRLPPLRVRPSDLAPLVHLVLTWHQKESTQLDPSVWPMLHRHGWPGNVRELRGVIEAALTRASSDRIGPEHLALDPLSPPSLPALADATFDTMRAAVESWYLRRLLHETRGNISEAARRADCSRKVLRDRLRRLGLYRAPFRSRDSVPSTDAELDAQESAAFPQSLVAHDAAPLRDRSVRDGRVDGEGWPPVIAPRDHGSLHERPTLH